MFRIRQWLHQHGRHRFCRDVRVVDHYDHGPRWLVGWDKDGVETRLDVTEFGGTPVYKTVHG